MRVTINDNELEVEVMGSENAPVLIAHHGGAGIGSLEEPRATFGSLARWFRIIVFDARGCGRSEGKPPFSHAQWTADVDALRRWAGAERIVVTGGSYGGFIALEYAIAYPEHVAAIILRDTSADNSNLDRAFENARAQTRIEINWDNFERYWSGRITDDEDLKARWAESSPSTTTTTTPSRPPRGLTRASTATRRTTGAFSTTCRTTISGPTCRRPRRRRSSPSVGPTG